MLWAESDSADKAQSLITAITQTISELMETPANPEEMISVTPSLSHQNPTLPEEKAFHFWNTQRYLGVRARTFSEFLDTLHYIEASSLTYHFRRGDFSNWVEHELRDSWLADQIRMLEADPDRLESLRTSLVTLLSQSVHHRRPEEATERKESETVKCRATVQTPK